MTSKVVVLSLRSVFSRSPLRSTLMRSILAATAILFAVSLSVAEALAESTFRARVTVALCPEYRWGGVEVHLQYTVGEAETIYEPTIISQTIDSDAITGVFDIALPNFMGTLPLNVSARCENAVGPSAPSNAVAISNCDALALKDSDLDGISNREEDKNCDNFFSPGDTSNPDNVDTDGDGIRDLVEYLSLTDPTNPASSPRPFILKGASFDPDGNGDANAVVWRPSLGMWFLRDFVTPGNNLQVQYGLPNDVPFAYQTPGFTSDVGVIRLQSDNQLVWFFHGPGFKNSDGSHSNQLSFGLFGDNIIPGPWETSGVTSPAVARLFNGVWTFIIYKADGTTRVQVWGQNGDLLKPDDYDGDGLYDFGLFRPSESKIYALSSATGTARVLDFGSGLAEHYVRGDYTGDGLADISFWFPQGGIFDYLQSDTDFASASESSLQLGLYNIHLPLTYNHQGEKDLFTVIDHTQGLRYWREDNNESNPVQSLQWGIYSDAQG